MSRPPKARLGLPGYVAVLANFKSEPCDIPTMYKRTGIGKDSTYKLVTELHYKGLIHVSGWNVRPRVATIPIYSYGPGKDAEPPATRENGRPIVSRLLRRTRARSEIMALASLIEALESPIAKYELWQETGVHRDTVGGFLAAMRQHDLARVCRYQPRDSGGGRYLAMWQLGGGANASYPSRKGVREKVARAWRSRVSALSPFAALAAVFDAANDQQAEAVA